MISAAKLAANRANAQKSTGPRTAAGKLRAAQNVRKSTGPITPAGKKRAGQNARRHGLTLPASRDPSLVEAIARWRMRLPAQVTTRKRLSSQRGWPPRRSISCGHGARGSTSLTASLSTISAG
jgi:hypothetical protein